MCHIHHWHLHSPLINNLRHSHNHKQVCHVERRHAVPHLKPCVYLEISHRDPCPMLWDTLDDSQEGWKWGIRVAMRCNKEVTPPPRSFHKGPSIGLWNDTACSRSSCSTHILIPHWSSLLSRRLLIGLGWRGYLPQSSLRWWKKGGSLAACSTSSRQENQVY